jgi:hypothetical protein
LCLLNVFLDNSPEFFLKRSAMLGFLHEPTYLSPGAVVDYYGWDSEHVHFVGYVTVLVEVNDFDVQGSVVCGDENFREIRELGAAFGVPFSCEDYEKVTVGYA